jgi:hypothetical protein
MIVAWINARKLRYPRLVRAVDIRFDSLKDTVDQKRPEQEVGSAVK